MAKSSFQTVNCLKRLSHTETKIQYSSIITQACRHSWDCTCQ